MAEQGQVGRKPPYSVFCPNCGVLNRVRQYGPRERPICGRCRTPLEQLPGEVLRPDITCVNVPDSCVLCGHTTPGGRSLSDGRMYHSECYAELLGLNEGLQQAAAAIEGRKREHLRAIARAGSIANRIRVYFGGSGVNVEARENALAELEQEERERSLKAAQAQRQLEDLWDYWTEYPPDWDERKAAARGASGVCEDCGADWQLHVHHRRQISNGGSHRPENLMLLCAECHGFRHGKDFSHRRTYRESHPGAFGHRIQVLRLAIHEARPVRFSYRKYSGEKSTRSLSPRRFKRVGRTLCVEGFCHLRGAVRTFAVRRMRGVRLTDNPQ